jgi:hypothetical protein
VRMCQKSENKTPLNIMVDQLIFIFINVISQSHVWRFVLPGICIYSLISTYNTDEIKNNSITQPIACRISRYAMVMKQSEVFQCPVLLHPLCLVCDEKLAHPVITRLFIVKR